MESFYGGRPGSSFIIVKTFETIEEMTQAFQGGTGYNQVYFDEYVNIYNINQPNYKYNGNVYRRGYDINNGLGGAQYVGNITGPAGPSTTIELYPYEKISPDNTDIEENTNLYTNNENDNSNDYNIMKINNESIDAFDFIPGAQQEENGTFTNFIDNIFFRYYFVKDTENRNQIMRIGFKIPYPVFKFQVERIDANKNPTIEKVDNGEHKFFHSWKIGLPIAVKGDSITKLSVLTVKNIDGTPNNSNINYSFYAPTSVEQQTKRASDLENKQSILICDIVKYNQAGTRLSPETYYVCDFNIIKNIDIDSQGYLIFTLPDGSQISSGVSILPTISSMSLNEYGEMSINWTNTNNTSGTSTFENQLKWIYDIDFNDDGDLLVTWNTKKINDTTGEVEYDKNNSPIRDSKLLTLSGWQHFITDLQIHNGKIYETHAGLRKEMCDLFNENDVNNAAGSGAQNIYNDAINNPNGTLYWWNTSNLTWYKQLFDMNAIVNSLVEAKINDTFPDIIKYYKQGSSIDNIVIDTTLKLIFDKNNPYGLQAILDIELPEKIPSDVIFSMSKIRQEVKNDIFNNCIIRKIYLQENSNAKNIYEKEEEEAQSIWQNLGFELFDGQNPCKDPWRMVGSNEYDYRFYTLQKYYYDNAFSSSSDAFKGLNKSVTAARKIFEGLPNLYSYNYLLFEGLQNIPQPSSGADYWNIENPQSVAAYLANTSESSGGTLSWWIGGDSIKIQNQNNTTIATVQKALPLYAEVLFKQILTGKDFELPHDNTQIYLTESPTENQQKWQNMINKVIRWNITVQDGKLHCSYGARGGSDYSKLAGKTITVPVTVELANLNF